MESRVIKVRYLITDYDQCAVAYNGTDPQMISIPFMQFAGRKESIKPGYYAGFYGCTHRSHKTRGFILRHAMKQIPEGSYTREDVEKHANTVTITQNLEARLKLPCIAVSTFEDTVEGRMCGQGYEEILKPVEEKGFDPKRRDCASFGRFLFGNLHDKNTQLVQIAINASAQKSADTKVVLHYVDDNPKILRNALAAPRSPNWPKQVIMKFFLHSATGDDSVITRIKTEDDLVKMKR